MIHVIDNSNREWADAEDLENAIFAMEHIGKEERIDLRAVDEDGKVLAVAIIDRDKWYWENFYWDPEWKQQVC